MKILNPVRFTLLAATLSSAAPVAATPVVPVATAAVPAEHDQEIACPTAAAAVPAATAAVQLTLPAELVSVQAQTEGSKWLGAPCWWTPWLLVSFGLATLSLILAVSFWVPPGPSILGAVGLAVRSWLAHALGVHGVPADAWPLPTPKRMLVLMIVAVWVFAGLVVAHVAVQAASQPF